MATTTTISALHDTAEGNSLSFEESPVFAVMLVTMLTLLAAVVGGYHPFSEDGGLYMAGIKQALNPALYPHGSEFVEGHLPYSLFVPVVSSLTVLSKLSLPVVLLLLHLATWWAMLFAGWMLATRCFRTLPARCGAVALLAVWLTLPVAGTSLMLMDPYLTARSISTPCGLLALVGALDYRNAKLSSEARFRGLLLCVVSLLFACAMHLLMGSYVLSSVLLLFAALSRHSRRNTLLLCSAAIAIAGAVQWFAPAEGAGYVRSAITRNYWFLGQWEWYEQFGLIAPLLILAFAHLRATRLRNDALAALTRIALLAGATAIVIALLFARPGLTSLLVARLQPLRIFQVVYVLMILVLGGSLGSSLLRASVLRWISAVIVLGGAMLYAQRQVYPSSDHLELPGTAPRNLWVQSFRWIKTHTPLDANFAIDAHYIGAPGEDAQTFRAIAERSVLPDYSKDGGEASISPAMSSAWISGVEAQTNLGQQTDTQRIERLRPLGATWLVLRRYDATGFSCPYANSLVKVCKMP